MKEAVAILQEFWGFDTFRNPQENVIEEIIKQNDVIALLPTGSGKSICFQVPTLMYESGVCLVISPLIALMKDQVENLQKRGIKAVALTGSLYQDDIVRIFDNLQYGGIRFLYMSPERLQSEFIQEKLKQLSIRLIAIDEAHCISEWGHDFRPGYLKLASTRELFPDIPIIALTATATKQVVADIEKYLNLKAPKIYRKPLLRPNLQLSILESADKLGTLFNLLQYQKEPTIVYTGSRRNCKRTSDYLNKKGLKSTFYHAGLSKSEKEKAFADWFSEKLPIMVATNAFGMGIDKANVRMVIHISMPNSIENYVQESGRAGRDGKPSKSIIIEEPADLIDATSYFTNTLPDVSFIKELYAHLNQYFHIPYGALPKENFEFNLASFCQQYNLPIVKTYTGLQLLDREEIIKIKDYSGSFSQVLFTCSNEQLFSYYQRNKSKEVLLKLLLRTYDGIFDTIATINLYNLAKKLNKPLAMVEKMLLEAQQDGIITFINRKNNSSIQFLKPREDNYTINTIAKDIETQQQVKKEKYRQMLLYISTNTMCRNRQISKYFGEKNTEDCGICDVCLSKNKSQKTNINHLAHSIKNALRKYHSLSSSELVQITKQTDKAVLECLQLLLDSDLIILTSQNKYRLNES